MSGGGAAAFVLSCPGPMRRHHASLLPISQLALPQCLLGSEAQLIGFAAAMPAAIRSRCFFAPLPEIFAGADRLRAAMGGHDGPIVHLRFGSVRTARVLKGVANAAVVVEGASQAPLATSGHPFASGHVLPAAMQRVFAFGRTTAPRHPDGTALPVALLPESCLVADLKGAPRQAARKAGGLDIASFAGFDSGAWAAGSVSGALPADGVLNVLLPWNLDHPGSIVPELLTRLARLQTPRRPRVRMIVLPFNYLGQTGLIRRLIAQVEAAADPAALANFAVARLTGLSALKQLLGLSRAAWVEAGDPEHEWTMARLAAAGFAPVALTGGEDALWIETATRYGTLAFHAAVPSLRELGGLLEAFR